MCEDLGRCFEVSKCKFRRLEVMKTLNGNESKLRDMGGRKVLMISSPRCRCATVVVRLQSSEL